MPRELCVCGPQPTSYEDLVADLCSSLRVKLERVVREACSSNFLFYLMETEDKSFFVRTKVRCQIFPTVFITLIAGPSFFFF